MSDFYAAAKKYPEFSRDQIDTFIEAFKQFDIDGNGHIDANELRSILDGIGVKATDKELQEQIAEVDVDKNGTVEWPEFLLVKSLSY
jgi:Ca2+-binding EF-hand superfamily protein